MEKEIKSIIVTKEPQKEVQKMIPLSYLSFDWIAWCVNNKK